MNEREVAKGEDVGFCFKVQMMYLAMIFGVKIVIVLVNRLLMFER